MTSIKEILFCFSTLALLSLFSCNPFLLGHQDLSVYDKNFQITYGVEGDSLFLQIPIGKYEIHLGAFESYKGKVKLYDLGEEQTVLSEKPLRYALPDLVYYVLQIDVVDLENGKRFRDNLVIDRNKKTITVKTKEGVLLKPYVLPATDIYLSDALGSKSFSLKYYDVDYRPAPPPYADGNRRFIEDELIAGQIEVAAKTPFKLNKIGLYYIKNDSTDAVFLNCFEAPYPSINKVGQLIEALRYITTHAEYQQLKNAEDPKLALDEYWLTRCSSKERARILIAAFYQRIGEANTFFTTYKEGWKTDRGMIYTIFGRPEAVEIYEKTEYWYYGDIDDRRSVHFYFDRRDGMYLLRRQSYLELPWMEQIRVWRSGVVPG